jgi:ATP phosphoribosyltransferase
LRTESYNFPLEIFFLRDDDIPEYVADGVADIGIVGENIVLEKGKRVETVSRLGFGKCRLSLAVPKNIDYLPGKTLEGSRIATSYPNILSKYLKEKGIQATLHDISGSVEIAPSIGLADAICDLVSSGSTLMMNGLKEVETILKSEAILIAAPQLNAAKQGILEQLNFRFDALLRAKSHKYILMNAPNQNIPQIIELLPGMRSPTVLPLAESGWSSIHTVVSESEFWSIIEQLKAAGAEGILVTSIEKMIL